jgi:hypothetical protein
VILTEPTFAAGVQVPATYTTLMSPQDITLHAASNAVDTALVLPNLNDNYVGTGPDLGAWERGQQVPTYGVRALAVARPNPPTDLAAE